MLPGSVPALALLHPEDPDKLFFFLGSCIFAVDLQQRKVVECSNFAMPDSPNELLMRSSHFVHVWQYDPSSSRKHLSLTAPRYLVADLIPLVPTPEFTSCIVTILTLKLKMENSRLVHRRSHNLDKGRMCLV
ncbi:unnamed protein product [Miscanthus lutarioriparius]|uniref:Uncharacterized protein n=1 Tax=Miscanthus lutarioriparius TaxID=422564 RepID=A0A811RAS8_9POAL|nr:unnamed protein product [Miscanthus lutarioriparius]